MNYNIHTTMETSTKDNQKSMRFNFVKTSGIYLRWKQVEVRDGRVFMRIGVRTKKVIKERK